MTSPLLQIEGLSKAFAGQLALDEVDLDVMGGEVHALLGQNGSGKSTLVKILAGFHQPEPGCRARLQGKDLTLGSAQSARDLGIRFVHQDLGLVERISAVENLAMGIGYGSSSWWRINWRREREHAARAVGELGFDIDVRRPVAELTAAERTGVAIARALIGWEDIRLLVLDEPTAALPVADVDRLFAAVRSVRERGLAVIFVSHHLDEIFEIADHVTILRDGRKIATEPVAGLDQGRLAGLIVGRALPGHADGPAPPAGRREAEEAVLRVSGVRGRSVADVSFAVRAGEIVGVTGLRGSGADDLAGLIVGRYPHGGDIVVDGSRLAGDPRDARANRVAFVPGDRLSDGLVSAMTVRENITLSGLGGHVRHARLSRRSERVEVRKWIDTLGIVTSGPDASILTLSGGNQQKVLLARALRTDPRVLVLDDPTRGVDIGAKAEIHRLVREVAGGGSGVVVVSSDTEELVGLCGRVVVLRAGRIFRTLEGDALNPEELEHSQLGGVLD